MTDKRRISEFLPEVLQTDILKKFFAATGDHLFQKEKVEYINGYIGSRPGYSQRDDVYVSEQGASRTNYQLAPTLVSRDSETNQVTHVLFYDDLLNKLRYQGALVDDHNRLFEAEYYSFGLPIDVDKWLNFNQYFWVPEGPARITLLSQTDVSEIQTQSTFTYQGQYSFENDVSGAASRTTPFSFSTGMKVRFTQDVNTQIRNIDYLVANVGQRITLIPENYKSYIAWENPLEWDSDVWDGSSVSDIANYITIARGSENGNPWSLGNRWFHRNVLEFTETNNDFYVGKNALRPILEFASDLKLWNFGTRSRGMINVVDSTTTSLDAILGKSSYLVKEDSSDPGVPLNDNMVILFTNLRDPANYNSLDAQRNNKLYRVTNMLNANSIVLTVVPNGSDTTGTPVEGDCVFVLQGNVANSNIKNTNIESSWYYTGGSWRKGQSRQVGSYVTPTVNDIAAVNQFPLFDLFDETGTNLAAYPGSTFAGSTLVQYRVGTTGVADPYLGFVTSYEDITPTNYIWDVTQVSDSVKYLTGNTLVDIPGYKFYQRKDPVTGEETYLNNWFKSGVPSRQYVVNEFWGTGSQTVFVADQAPDITAPQPPAITVDVGTTKLVQDVDYTVADNTVTLAQAPANGTLVKIRTWGGTTNTATSGYFEIPSNLQNNPNNLELSHFTRADFTAHAESIVFNQKGFAGSLVGANNYRDSAQDQSLGTEILQHRAPLLKLMGLNAPLQTDAFAGTNSRLDPFVAIQWAQSEYLRFYNKIINNLVALYNGGGITAAQSAQEWLSLALSKVNVGKTQLSAWANSGFDLSGGLYCSIQSTAPTWVPASATRLGVTPAYVPTAYYDYSQPPDPVSGEYPLSMRCHNGAIVVLKDLAGNSLGSIQGGGNSTTDYNKLTHPVSKAWLLFEQLMFNSLPSTYSDAQRQMPLDTRTIFSGKYRTTNYSRANQLTLLSPGFQRWCTFNQVDAFRNTGFDINDPFTWNYRGCTDRDGMPVPGHWRGIYFWYFDTDEPHNSPWQMLGFSQKPSWWDTEYGAAPYTGGNLKMWQDLEMGRIAQGPRAGVWSEWARPGLSNNIPVNDIGQLLPPFEAGVVTSLPSVVEASQDWLWGDRSPIENVWLTTVDSDFIWATTAYLTKPAQFTEYLWDGVRQQQIYSNQTYSQWISTDTLKRKSSSEYYVHRENPQDVLSLSSDATYYGSCGIQHWISEYLVSDSLSVTRYFGNVVRGLQPVLAHKMGGFTSGDSLRLVVDSFGIVEPTLINQGRKDSLILPQEDSYVELLRSPSVQESVYTGVIIEYRGEPGWRVIGYDAVEPYFTIVPSNTRGVKNTVVQDNQRVIEYRDGLPTTQKVAYGTIFRTRQEVYDFLISLGRYQIQQGWVFDQFDQSTNRMRDWSLSAREFLFWSQGPWAPGTYIQLSPLATLVKYKTAFGLIQNVGSIINGAYSILDKSGRTIPLSKVDFLRLDDEISVKPLNDQGIFGLRLSVSSIEHAVVFNNFTIFGDTVYNPLLNQKQSRFHALGLRTLDWNGRLEAPGYMVTQTTTVVGGRAVVKNSIIPNFEKSAEDLRLLFENNPTTTYALASAPNTQISSAITQTIPAAEGAMAKHLIGYQPRDYLNNLLVDNSVAYQFYQGMISQKGTENTILALLRNTNVLSLDQTLDVYEEYGFRSSTYGATRLTYGMDVILDQSQVKSNPQVLQLLSNQFNDNPNDLSITILEKDTRIVNTTPETPPFLLRTHYGADINDLPNSGYVLMNEVDWLVRDNLELDSLYTTQLNAALNGTGTMLKVNDVVWQVIDTTKTWNVWKLVSPSWSISYTEPSKFSYSQTTIYTSAAHHLKMNDKVVIFGVVNTGTAWNGTYSIVSVTDTSFTINVLTSNVGAGGQVWIYQSLRFNNITERDSAYTNGYLAYEDLAYVDGTSTTPWIVYKRGVFDWFEYRVENLKVDPRYMVSSRLYNKKYLDTLAILTYYDPAKNHMPGVFDREISFKTPYDPAKYTMDPTGIYGTAVGDAWGSEQVGVVWWDLSTTRFMDYEIGTDSYRRQHWGAIAPRTSIDIYEWVRSTVPPASWANLVAKGTDLSAIGSTNPPSGTVRSSNSPYSMRWQPNSNGDLVQVYYFWVKNTVTVPDVPGRSISTSVLSNMITNPSNNNIAWWSPISDTTLLIGNIGDYLNGDQTVWQVNWTSSLDLGNVHKEWALIRAIDPESSPTQQLWNKMKDSLLEYNSVGDSVPNLRLSDLEKYGILIRPSQTMFDQANGARRALVDLVNAQLKDTSTPPESDTERTNWLGYFNSSEPPPPSKNLLNNIRLATIPGVQAAHTGASLVGTTIEVSSADLATNRIQTGWYVDGPGIGISAQIINVVYGNGVTPTVISLDPIATSYIVQGYTYQFTPWSTFYDNSLDGVGARLILRYPGPILIDGVQANANDRILVKDQFNQAENGIYVVTEVGVASAGPNDPGTSTILTRSEDFNTPGDTLYLAQCRIQEGATNINRYFYQSNQNILYMGIDAQTWLEGVPPANWVRQVPDLMARDALNYQLPFGSRVLVDANSQTSGKWTIWEWTREIDTAVGYWNLVQVQGYKTSDCWQLVDWYAAGYSELTQVDYVFDTLEQRDAYLSFQTNDIVRVNNTGAGLWGIYVYFTSGWLLVGAQNQGVQLSDRLWDYEKYQMGFGGGGFDSDGQGFEYDSRLELEQIIQGLWNTTGTGGLLLQNSTVNQPNQIFFDMVNRSLVDNTFLDYVFKSSYITLRGFSETLEATPYYTTNKIDSLIAYVNEVKPYHVQIRQFVDSRKAQDTYQSASSDFDKPPYVDPNSGVRILDDTKPTDQQLLSTLDAYKGWYNNYQTNPDLIRSIRTKLIYNRVACAQDFWYAPGYSADTPITTTVNTLADLYTLSNATAGVIVKVVTDAFDRWSIYERNNTVWDNSNPMQAWTLVAYQHNMGAIDTIIDSYQPTANMTPLDSPLLVSGCAGSLATLDGSEFNSEDAWDQTVWDNVRGWSYSADSNISLDQSISGAPAPKYITFSGDGVTTEFSLPWAPQDPNHLKIWVNGVIQHVTADWEISNYANGVLVANRGTGYSVNDVLVFQGGQEIVPASVQVTDIDLVGAIVSVTLINPGSYGVVPATPVNLQGGTGVGATVSVLWGGKTIRFLAPPSKPTKGANIWVVENGSTFNPAVSSVLDAVFDGSGLNRPHLEAGHPEELTKIWARNSLSLNVYTHPSPGWGNVLTSTYVGDGITDQFDIGQNVFTNSQIWVYVNGSLVSYATDYVVNTEYMRIVFLVAPVAGSHISIISVGSVSAGKSLGSYMILDSGQDYVLFDSVRLAGGEVTEGNYPVVQITAVKGVGLTVIDGGSNYREGDVLIYKYGESRESLSIRVTSVATVGGTRGIIQTVELVTAGYYTNLTAGVSDWYTSGNGLGAVINPSWGVAALFVQGRGSYFSEPTYLVQSAVIPQGSSPGTGSGLTLFFGKGTIREELKLVGDGNTNTIQFSQSVFGATLLITFNGVITYNYTFDSQDPSIVILGFVPQLDDVVYAVVYNSQLYSANSQETVVADGINFTYTLSNPPGYTPLQTKNSLVYWNNRKLKQPLFKTYTADGMQTSFAVGDTPTASTDLTVWINTLQLAPAQWALVGSNVVFAVAPAAGSVVSIQYADPVKGNFEYTISFDKLTIANTVPLMAGDAILVQVFTEDSHTSFVSDSWSGTSPAVYQMSQVPTTFGSVQVFVNGILATSTWDYVLANVGGVVEIRFGAGVMHGAMDVIEAYYPTEPPAQPAVAFRLFTNIYDQTQAQRISNAATTRLLEPIDLDSTEIVVEDGTGLAAASTTTPAAIWVGNERIEYTAKSGKPTSEFALAAVLKGIRRGTLGTPNGVQSVYSRITYNGDGSSLLFLCYSANVIVLVNDVEQINGVDYVIVENPPSRLPGIYVEFFETSVPPFGNANIMILTKSVDDTTSVESHPAGALVRDASADQTIPGGYIWPAGNQGIQYSDEPQTTFLLKEPGTRMV